MHGGVLVFVLDLVAAEACADGRWRQVRALLLATTRESQRQIARGSATGVEVLGTSCRRGQSGHLPASRSAGSAWRWLAAGLIALEFASGGAAQREEAGIIGLIIVLMTVGVALIARGFGMRLGVRDE
jgi:hypothetical protein